MTVDAVVVTSERDLLGQIIKLSALLGWEAAHFRPALTQRGWRTPVQGSLGKGFPDLILVRSRDRRLILAELKSNAGKLSPDQVRVHEVLEALDGASWSSSSAGAWRDRHEIGIYVWRPRDWDSIVDVLR
ncbi:MAG TPA: VRR-NUC domain-containing protein [Candidatus Limnocylindrales bacterium]|jgi:hypothetical protein